MTADRLLALYDRVADAPDAVGRLRQFVLDLAVRGKLVEQDPVDGPAPELLKRIKEGKGRLARSNRAKESKPLPPVDPRKIPFELPSTWRWVYFGNIVEFAAGRTPPRKEVAYWNTGDFPWVSIADMADGETVRSTKESVSVEARLNVFKREPEPAGTMIMSFKLTIGKIAKLGIRAFHNEAIISIWSGVAELDSFLFRVLPDLARNATAKGAVKGATLNRQSLARIMVPLPPLPEQRRIVAKVDELMALCNRLEEARAAREDTRDRLTKASLARLSAPGTDVPAFRSHARFAVDALPALTARADQIKHLRQTILSLAVRGKLVEQDQSDEPASELLKRIAVEKARLVKAGEIRKPRALKPLALDVDESSLSLPKGWEWAPLAGISYVTMGQSPPGDTYNRSGDGVPLINGPVEFTAGPFGQTIVNQFTTAPTKLCQEGDLLICVRGSTTGRTNVAAFRACIGRGVAAICSSFDDEFIRLFLWKVREDIISMGRGIAFPSVSKKQLENLAIPLPPLAEQRRIVAKVDDLMTLCDELEAGLDAAGGTRSLLLDSLLHESLGSHVAVINGKTGGVTRIGT